MDIGRSTLSDPFFRVLVLLTKVKFSDSLSMKPPVNYVGT